MAATQTNFKKINKYILMFVAHLFAFPQITIAADCDLNSTCTTGHKFCNSCITHGDSCADPINDSRISCKNSNYYGLNTGCLDLIAHGCSFYNPSENNGNTICCYGLVGEQRVSICLKFENGTISASTNSLSVTVNGSLPKNYIPYFNTECKVATEWEYGDDSSDYTQKMPCRAFDSNLSSLSFNGYPYYGISNVSIPWNNAHAQWGWPNDDTTNGIAACGGTLFTDWFDYAPANCSDYIQAQVKTTVSYDSSGKNKIWFARNALRDFWKIKYTTTSSSCTPCDVYCKNHYTYNYNTSDCPGLAICEEALPECETGFAPQREPWRCNVDSNITYTDSTGTFTLSNGSYDPDASEPGYLNNTICPVNNN